MYQQQQMTRPPREITLRMRKNYFKSPPPWPKLRDYVFAVIGLVVAFSFQTSFSLLVLGICSVPLIWRIIWWLVYIWRSTMTDQEYDQWIWCFVDIVQQEGLEKFRTARIQSSVDATLPPLQGFLYSNDDLTRIYSGSIKDKVGKDGHPRSSVSRFIIIYIAEHEICVYIRDINALSDFCFNKADSYYYHDVVGVGTSTAGYSKVIEEKDKNKGMLLKRSDQSNVISLNRFDLKISSGETIGLKAFVENQYVNQAVDRLRILLGQKKYGPGHGYRPEGYPGGFGGPIY